MEKLVSKYMYPIAEPARLPACPPLIRELGQATQRARAVVIDEGGRRERMPIGVIVFSYFLGVGRVLPSPSLTDPPHRSRKGC